MSIHLPDSRLQVHLKLLIEFWLWLTKIIQAKFAYLDTDTTNTFYLTALGLGCNVGTSFKFSFLNENFITSLLLNQLQCFASPGKTILASFEEFCVLGWIYTISVEVGGSALEYYCLGGL